MPIADVNDLTEYQVYDHLQAGGFFDAFSVVTNAVTEQQSAPVVQVGLYDESEVDANDRILLIRSANAGGPSDDIVRYENCLIAFAGKSRLDDWSVAKYRLAQIHRYLLENFKSDCIINYDDLSDVTGPFSSESNRPVFEINFRLTLDR